MWPSGLSLWGLIYYLTTTCCYQLLQLPQEAKLLLQPWMRPIVAARNLGRNSPISRPRPGFRFRAALLFVLLSWCAIDTNLISLGRVNPCLLGCHSTSQTNFNEMMKCQWLQRRQLGSCEDARHHSYSPVSAAFTGPPVGTISSEQTSFFAGHARLAC